MFWSPRSNYPRINGPGGPNHPSIGGPPRIIGPPCKGFSWPALKGLEILAVGTDKRCPHKIYRSPHSLPSWRMDGPPTRDEWTPLFHCESWHTDGPPRDAGTPLFHCEYSLSRCQLHVVCRTAAVLHACEKLGYRPYSDTVLRRHRYQVCYPGCIQQLELIARNCRPRKRYAEAGWKGGMALPYGDCAFPMTGSSIVTNLAAPSDRHARTRALRAQL